MIMNNGFYEEDIRTRCFECGRSVIVSIKTENIEQFKLHRTFIYNNTVCKKCKNKLNTY